MTHNRQRTVLIAFIAVFILAMAGLVVGTLQPAGATGVGGSKVPICHATGSESNPYENGGGEIPKARITAQSGHDSHPGDIIPPFPAGVSGKQRWAAYPGKNWVEPFITIFNSGCEVSGEPEPEVCEPPTTGTPPDCVTPTEEPTTPVEPPVVVPPVVEPPVVVPPVVEPPVVETPVVPEEEEETPTPETDEPKPEPKPNPGPKPEPKPEPKTTSSVRCEDGVWVTEIVKNGVITSTSMSGSCEQTVTNSEPIFSVPETGL